MAAIALAAGIVTVAIALGAVTTGAIAQARVSMAADAAALAAATAAMRFHPDPCAGAEVVLEGYGRGSGSAGPLGTPTLTACSVRHPTAGPTVDVVVSLPFSVWLGSRIASGEATAGVRPGGTPSGELR